MKKQSLFIILPLIILCSCAVTHEPAPIEYGHDNSNLRSSSKTVPTLKEEGEVISSGSFDSDKPNEAITQLDDENFILPAPNPLESNQKIIYHEVQIGETIEDIAKQYNQEVGDIAELNDLSSPYYLDEFQILKVRKLSDNSINSSANKKIEEPLVIVKQPDIQDIEEPKKVSSEYMAPVDGKIIIKFGQKTQFGINKGVSIAASSGTKVIATAAGKVIYADYDATFGNLVLIKLDSKNIITSYAHLKDIILSKGAHVNQGDIIGYVGSTGKVSEPQLHFGIREGKVAKDPEHFVSF